jgi:predicted amidohydrolase YtcJ
MAALQRKAAITPPGKLISGYGYNDVLLGRHPKRYDLDKVSTTQPIIITHGSGHISVVNSRAIVVRPATRSVGASPAAPPGGIRQHEQVQTAEQEQGEREHRQEAHPRGIFPLYHGDDVDDDGHRKGHGQPAVGLPNPFVPVQ